MKHDEYKIQCALVEWCRIVGAIPGYADVGRCIASANEGRRDIRAAVRLKRQGVIAGVPDLFWPAARGASHGLWIELKTDRGRLSDAQSDWLDYLTGCGHMALVCYGLEQAIEVVSNYFGVQLARH